ncbi:DNA-binding Xre family transcriptional regulator [Aneurinibacillus soli]|uniref:Helix-turn-helix domain protein n=1 Tax=Aneurinibacillus soli TaxID=1500254 RepID=A0A0U4WHQ9_9BACL|nr:helix-turn-helix transcriptional regulator [Aneurinibacillus soli]PYE64267.1 DNA-binding Xre family transcriptional regulator [Aneurinibacillus soli]BAU28216.1 Helix-turn-helix domain protein [Aneurinibacillus soli]
MARKIKSRLHILMGMRKIKSINELSRLTGISNPTLTRFYNDKNDRIDYKTIITLCDFFNVPLSELLVLEEDDSDN